MWGLAEIAQHHLTKAAEAINKLVEAERNKPVDNPAYNPPPKPSNQTRRFMVATEQDGRYTPVAGDLLNGEVIERDTFDGFDSAVALANRIHPERHPCVLQVVYANGVRV